MRNKFDIQLDLLNNNLISMGALCEDAIACAVKSLITGDESLSQRALDGEREIDGKEKEIENLCLKLLLEQQPVARDLRLISAALKMITDMERIGDQAADIAELIEFVSLPVGKNNEHISLMASNVITMVTDSIDAFVKGNIEIAERVIKNDDIVDDLFVKIKNDLIKFISENPENGENALDILMIAKYLERIGDHATNIAEWVEFSITGEHI